MALVQLIVCLMPGLVSLGWVYWIVYSLWHYLDISRLSISYFIPNYRPSYSLVGLPQSIKVFLGLFVLLFGYLLGRSNALIFPRSISDSWCAFKHTDALYPHTWLFNMTLTYIWIVPFVCYKVRIRIKQNSQYLVTRKGYRFTRMMVCFLLIICIAEI
jgi:hypothetical protein